MPKVVTISGKLKEPLFGMKVPAWLALSTSELRAVLTPTFEQVFADTERQFKDYLLSNDNSVPSGKVEHPGAKGTFDRGTLYKSLSHSFDIKKAGAKEFTFYYRVGSDAPHFQYIDEGFRTGDEGINLTEIESWMKRLGSGLVVVPEKRRRPGFAKRKNASSKTPKERAWDATVTKIWRSTRNREYRGLFLRKRLIRFYQDSSRRYGLPERVHATLWRPTDSSGLNDDN